jgi:hypothetical protein
VSIPRRARVSTSLYALLLTRDRSRRRLRIARDSAISAIAARCDPASALPENARVPRESSAKRGRCRRSRVSRDPRMGPLPSPIIVNPNKRERVRATLRVGHKSSVAASAGENGACHPSSTSSSCRVSGSASGPGPRFVLRRDTRPSASGLRATTRQVGQRSRGSGRDSS